MPQPSTNILTNASVNTVAAGVSVPMFCFLGRICVRLHPKPPIADAENTHEHAGKVEGSSRGYHESDTSGDESDDEYKTP